jgi:hypothetical protein
MNLKNLLDSIHESVELSTPEELKKACELIIRVQNMNSGERDTLLCAHKHGPIFDGDVPSKTARDQLVSEGFMEKVVVKGQDGYNACTYKGNWAHHLIEAGA